MDLAPGTAASNPEIFLELREICKSYDGAPLLSTVSFKIERAETVALLGPSGSGKSTLLLIIAGLEAMEGGQVLWRGTDLAGVPAHLRDFGLVFQDYALFPHMDVGSNVAFGLRMRGADLESISSRVGAVLELVNLSGFQRRRVSELSGGEQQRVALARALAPAPRMLMFDEPLSALDRALRADLQLELRSILQQTGVPAIYVTHDQEEAFALGDRLLLLHDGRIVREGAPAEVAADPRSTWTARFLGLGTVAQGTVETVGTTTATAKTSWGPVNIAPSDGLVPRGAVSLLVRPSQVRLSSSMSAIRSRVIDVVFQREQYRISLENGLYLHGFTAPKVGASVGIEIERAEVLPDG